MKIAIDVRSIQYDCNAERGIGQYLKQLLCSLANCRPDWKLGLFVEFSAPSRLLDGLKQASSNIELHTYKSINAFQPDLFLISDQMSLIPGFESPLLFVPKNIPISVLLYDFIPIKAHQGLWDRWPLFLQHGYQSRLEQLKALKPHYLAISHSTAKDAEEILGVQADQIDVIMAGPNHVEHQLSKQDIDNVLSKFQVTNPFYLCVGGQDLHKNFELTLNAFLAIHNSHKVQLVVAGSLADSHKVHYKSELTRAGVRDVIFTDYIDSLELQALYKSAIALCFPSRYEGFGFPVLEAMSLGCPVITTRCASLPEVGGNAAMYVSPDSTDEMLQTMKSLYNNEDIRSHHQKLGEVQSNQFSWCKTAEYAALSWERLYSETNMSNRDFSSLCPDMLSQDFRYLL